MRNKSDCSSTHRAIQHSSNHLVKILKPGVLGYWKRHTRQSKTPHLPAWPTTKIHKCRYSFQQNDKYKQSCFAFAAHLRPPLFDGGVVSPHGVVRVDLRASPRRLQQVVPNSYHRARPEGAGFEAGEDALTLPPASSRWADEIEEERR